VCARYGTRGPCFQLDKLSHKVPDEFEKVFGDETLNLNPMVM
jgi:hypothetical protein